MKSGDGTYGTFKTGEVFNFSMAPKVLGDRTFQR